MKYYALLRRDECISTFWISRQLHFLSDPVQQYRLQNIMAPNFKFWSLCIQNQFGRFSNAQNNFNGIPIIWNRFNWFCIFLFTHYLLHNIIDNDFNRNKCCIADNCIYTNEISLIEKLQKDRPWRRRVSIPVPLAC